MPIGGIIGAVGSVVGGILGHNAANDAASIQAKASQTAATSQAQAGTQAQNALTSQISNEAKVSSPYTELGANAGGELNALLAPGGQLTQGWNQTFQAPTADQAAQTPGYQFQLSQGLNALQNSAAARGGLLSTGTAKNLNNYAQGVASTNYQNTFNNALQAYGTNFNTFNTNQNNLYNRLAGATGIGENAANNLNALQAQGTGQLANNIVGNQQAVNQYALDSWSAECRWSGSRYFDICIPCWLYSS